MKRFLMLRILLLHLLFFAICGCGGAEPDSGSATLSGEQSETAASGGSPPTSSGTRSFAPAPPVMVENEIRDGVEPVFSDAATALGIEFRFFEDRVPGRFLLPEVMGGGVAWLDVDLDGWQDLYFANGAVLGDIGNPDTAIRTYGCLYGLVAAAPGGGWVGSPRNTFGRIKRSSCLTRSACVTISITASLVVTFES